MSGIYIPFSTKRFRHLQELLRSQPIIYHKNLTNIDNLQILPHLQIEPKKIWMALYVDSYLGVLLSFPSGTPSGKGFYLTLCHLSCPNTKNTLYQISLEAALLGPSIPRYRILPNVWKSCQIIALPNIWVWQSCSFRI